LTWFIIENTKTYRVFIVEIKVKNLFFSNLHKTKGKGWGAVVFS
jgi:hypothetical protein